MGSDDFISLEPTIDSELQEEENGSNSKAFGEDGEMEEGEHEQDMDLESDSEEPLIKGKNKLVESTVIGEKQKITQPENKPKNASAFIVSKATVNSHLVDEYTMVGTKRARMAYEDEQQCVGEYEQPSVRVVYNSLTKESKKKLIELMQQWSEWHSQSNPSLNVSSKETLERGVETYFPALHVGVKRTSVSFWVDNIRNEDIKSVQLDDDSVPLYDRGYTLGSTSLGGSADSERIETLEASRCFNCGSYSHSLKECSKPRDNAAVNNARKQHNSSRKSIPASQGQARYYLKPKGKFDDVKPGVLGPETRKSLGIGEFDPPPWLNRMRQLGYPPGYLDDVEEEDEPSGITIFGIEEPKLEEPKVEYEDGELPEKANPIPAEKKKTVDFPGINAPIPDNADDFLWSTHANSSRSRVHHDRPSWLMDPRVDDGPQRGHLYRDEGPPPPPGTEHRHSFSPRYSPHDHSNSSHDERSPSFGRSLSDRGWHSSAGHSPYANSSPNVSRPSSAYQYPSPSPSGNSDHYYHQHHHDRWNPKN